MKFEENFVLCSLTYPPLTKIFGPPLPDQKLLFPTWLTAAVPPMPPKPTPTYALAHGEYARTRVYLILPIVRQIHRTQFVPAPCAWWHQIYTINLYRKSALEMKSIHELKQQYALFLCRKKISSCVLLTWKRLSFRAIRSVNSSVHACTARFSWTWPGLHNSY